LKFLGTSHINSNSFFHELFNLQSLIVQYSDSVDSIWTNMAKKMKLKFDKYWANFEDMNMLLFVAVVLDRNGRNFLKMRIILVIRVSLRCI